MSFFEHNARHHDDRAAAHRANGREDYALGSERKAEKWREKERVLNALVSGPRLTAFERVIDDHMKSTAKRMCRDMEVALHG